MHFIGPTGITRTDGASSIQFMIEVMITSAMQRRQILGSVTVVGMVTVYHMLLKALWFDHAAANITDYSIERIGFWTQPVQSHIGLI